MKFLSIQYLRGAAALLIILYHVFAQLFRMGYPGFQPQFLSVGVDIFFVISGFIMWYTTFNKNIGTLEFYRYRVIRIVPLYWLVTTFYLAVLLVKPTWMQSAKFDLYHVAASYLFVPAAHPIAQRFMWPLVVPGWSLNYEMFFYLLFGLALLSPSRVRAAIIVAVIICFVGMQVLGPHKIPIIEFYSSSIILEFALGVVLGWLFTSGASIPRLPSTLVMLAGIIGLTACSFLGLPDSQRILTRGIPAFFIVAGAIFYERAHIVPELEIPKLLGDSSYSLYLSHGATLSAFAQYWHYLGFPNMSEPLWFILFSLAAIIIAIMVGIGLYQFVERPLLHRLSVRIKRTNHKSYHRLPVG